MLAWPGLPAAAKLKGLGVRRLSAGSGIAKVVLSRVHAMNWAFLAGGDSEPLSEGALNNPGINRLMKRG